MIGALIHLCIILAVLIVVWYVVRLAATTFKMPESIVQVLGLIFLLIFLLYTLQVLGLVDPWVRR